MIGNALIVTKSLAQSRGSLTFYTRGNLAEILSFALSPYRICYKKLSNTLIIHLKRFDYSIDAMGDIKQFKITDFFEFPLELDMEPYTTEGIAKLELIEAEKKKIAAAGGDVEG